MVNIPSSLTVGDTWSWSAEYALYPATGWTATAYFENADNSFSISSSASGTLHAFAETAANTAAFKAGSYYVVVRVTDGTTVKTTESGWSSVLADPESAAKVDHRSWARRTLEAIEAFLEGNATTAQASASVGGRAISRWSISELVQWRDKLKAEVAVEDQAANAGLGRDVKVRYGRP